MKRMGLSIIVGLAVLAFAGGAMAAPLIEGESKLTDSTGATFIRVDWQVFSPGDATAPLGATAGLFQYVYQVEVTTAQNDVSSFTISFNPGKPFTTWSNVAGNLVEGSEVNPNNGNAPLVCCDVPTAQALGVFTANAQFNPLVFGPNHQSDRLVGTSPFGPGPGLGDAVDGAPGSPWSSAHPGGQTIPIPTPEPTTLMLLGLATGLMGFAARRK